MPNNTNIMYPHHQSPLMERKAKPVEKEEFERVQRALRQDRYGKARGSGGFVLVVLFVCVYSRIGY